jgi:hypothetical protein
LVASTNALHTAPRSALPLIATALLAALFLLRGILHPQLNYDVIAYAALAKEMRGDGGKVEAYRELALKVGSSGFQQYVSGSYRERMYRDDDFFRANLPLYTSRPFYILLCSLVGSLVHSDVAATYIISAVAASLAVLLSYAIGAIAGLAGNWRLAVPLTWVAAGGLNLAGLSTPDALATLAGLLFVLTSITGPWKGVRAICLILLAVVMVTARADYLLLVTLLMLLEWLLEPRSRLISTLVFLGALSTNLVIQKISDYYGYVASLNFSFFDRSVVPNLVPNLHGYILTAIHYIVQILGENFEYAQLTLAVSLLAIVWSRERRVRAMRQGQGFNQRALILSAALAVYLIVRFAFFPLPEARYMMIGYVLAGILFARAVQPIAATQPDPSGEKRNQ